MGKEEIIERVRRSLVRITTPYHKGTGFVLEGTGLIVTNADIVSGHPYAIIWGFEIERCKMEVLVIDSVYGLALLSVPDEKRVQGLQIQEDELEDGSSVIAIGFPSHSDLAMETGSILRREKTETIAFYRHDAVLSSGYTGGPLLDEEGAIAGLNVFDLLGNEENARALPVQYIRRTVNAYLDGDGGYAVRCEECQLMQFSTSGQEEVCSDCGGSIVFPNQWTAYQPMGMAKSIERMLEQLGYEAELTRRGPDNWQIQRGSASIHISYHEKTGMIVGDAVLCTLGSEVDKDLYEYLLRENHSLQHLTFSIRDSRVVLSLLIYDRYFTVDTGTRLFDYLFIKSDEYDDLLVDKYGAKWLKA